MSKFFNYDMLLRNRKRQAENITFWVLWFTGLIIWTFGLFVLKNFYIWVLGVGITLSAGVQPTVNLIYYHPYWNRLFRIKYATRKRR